MAESSLNRTGEKRPVTQRGHGTAALGPSDSTDSGISEDFPLDTTLATRDEDSDANLGVTSGDEVPERDVEREEPTSERARGTDVEVNTPLLDRSHRDDGPGRPR